MKKARLVGLALSLGGCASTSPSCDVSLSREHCRVERLLYQNDPMPARILVAVAAPDGYPLAAAVLERSARFDRRGQADSRWAQRYREGIASRMSPVAAILHSKRSCRCHSTGRDAGQVA